MKILANRNIKIFFHQILYATLLFTFCAFIIIIFSGSRPNFMTVCLLFCPLGTGMLILAGFYRYFKEQNRALEYGAEQIRNYLSGSGNSLIECNEEGELYRLFHEVNSLVSVLNAHVEKEGREKRFLKDTISDISHQLKTPLAALNIYNGIIQGEAKELPAIREFADLSEQELDRIELLIRNLLNIARFDAGAMVMDKEEESLWEIMEQVRERFRFRAEKEEKEILLLGEEDVSLWCDRGWMTEAVGNLVKNALDHTQKGGIIKIEWKQNGAVVRIAVRDNGKGICREDLYHIFKRFYRSRYSQDTRGIGLGLPLAKAVTEAHGGTIQVDSQPGRGTVFTMDFLQNCSPKVTGL